MKKIFLLTILLFVTNILGVVAQSTCRVSGVVCDAMGETIPYATIGAYQNSKDVKRMAAGADGEFVMELPQSKTYVIEITSIGYAPFRTEIEIGAEKNYDMGSITLEASTQLQEVVVKAQKPLIKSDAEKITYDVTADPESDNKTLLEVLRKVPMVTVDAEDNVQINGSSSFKVLVNGKESVMLKNNLKDVLKSMPASGVKDVQVITNPSTKYDAEGVGGILNIVTAQAEVGGFTGTITAGGNIQGGFWGNAYLALQRNKLTTSLNYSGGRFVQKQNYRMESVNYNNYDIYRTLSHTLDDLNIGGQYHNLTLESSYELDSLNLFSLGVSGSLGDHSFSGNTQSETFTYAGHRVGNYIDRITRNGNWNDISANFDYQHTFGRPMHILTASYFYEYNPNGGAYSDSILYDDETLMSPFLGQKNENNTSTQEHTIQLDYSNPINNIHSVEAGVKYIARINHSNDDYMMLDDNAVWQSMDRMQTFDYTQQIVALYAGYGVNLGSWGLRAGGRYEATFIDASFVLANDRTDYGKPYCNFVPYLSANYAIDPMQSLRFSYTQRINRPGIGYLSPYEEWTTPTMVSMGNPNLLPEVSHSFGAGYSLFKGVFNLNMQWNTRISSNAIESYTMIDAATGVRYTTYGNIASSQNHSLSMYISGQPSAKLGYYVNLSPGYQIYNVPRENRKYEKWVGMLFAGCNWTAWKDGTLSFNVGGGIPGMNDMQAQSKRMFYYYGLGVAQRFLNDKLKVTLSANNFLEKYMQFDVVVNGDGFKNSTHISNVGRNVQLSVSYTFGKLDAKVKKAVRGIVNDDIVGNSSQGMSDSSTGSVSVGK